MKGVSVLLLLTLIVCSLAYLANTLSSSEDSTQVFLETLVTGYNQQLSPEDKDDEDWIVGPATFNKNEFVQNFTLPFLERNEESERLVYETFYTRLKKSVCENENGISAGVLQRDVAMSYSFKDMNGSEVLYLSFDKYSCLNN